MNENQFDEGCFCSEHASLSYMELLAKCLALRTIFLLKNIEPYWIFSLHFCTLFCLTGLPNSKVFGKKRQFIPHPSLLIHHPSPLIPHPSPLIHHPSSITPHPSPLIHHPSDNPFKQRMRGNFPHLWGRIFLCQREDIVALRVEISRLNTLHTPLTGSSAGNILQTSSAARRATNRFRGLGVAGFPVRRGEYDPPRGRIWRLRG